MEPLVAAALFRRTVARIRGLGVDRAALLAEAGLTEDVLSITRLRLPWRLVEDVLEAGERLTGDPRLGLRLALGFESRGFTLPELVFLACGTLREGMKRARPLLRLWSDAESWSLHDGDTRIRYSLRTPPRRAHVLLHEHALALPVHVIRGALGVPMTAARVRFAHPGPDDPEEYDRFFGCRVEWGQGVTEITMAPEDLDRPIRTANPLFSSHFGRQAEAELASLESTTSLSERLRAHLEADLAAGTLATSTLESCATRMFISARTLQRGLAGEDTTFAAELDRFRRDAAERLLAAGIDIAEVSWRLGYAEPPVFHRAFRRWTGDTPQAWRRRRAQQA